MKVRYKLNGKEVSRAKFLEHKIGGAGVAMISRTYQDHKPLIGEGAGVLPHQVPEAREILRQQGIQGVKIRDDGSLEQTSRQGRMEWNKFRGIVDLDGMYGD